MSGSIKARKILAQLLQNPEQSRADLGDQYDHYIDALTAKANFAVASRGDLMTRPSGMDAVDAQETARPREGAAALPAPQPLPGQKPWQLPTTPEQIEQPQHMSPDEQLEYFKAKELSDAQFYDTNAPTASKLKELHTPAEYTPQGGGMLSTAAHAMTRQYFEEPPLEAFREEMRNTLGDGVDKMDEGSLAYRAYADKKWKNAYAKAVAAGEPVTRVAFADNASAKLGSIGNTATVLGHGFIRGATANMVEPVAADLEKVGLLPAGSVENARLVEGAHPIAGGIGYLAGALLPTSLASRAAGMVGKGLGRAAPWLPGAAKAGLVGGGGAAIEGGVSDVSSAASDEHLGHHEAAVQGLQNEVPKTLLRVGGGGGIGMLAHGLGTLAGRGAKAIERSDDIRETLSPAEASGIELGPIGGARMPARAKGLIDEQVAAKVPDVVAMHAENLREPLARNALHMQQSEIEPLAKKVHGYYASPQGQKLVPIRNTALAVLDELRSRSNPEVAKARPFADVNVLKAKLPELVRVDRVVPAETADYVNRDTGNIVLRLDDARRMGIDVRALARKSGTPAAESTMDVTRNELITGAGNTQVSPHHGPSPNGLGELEAVLDPDNAMAHQYAVLLKPERMNAEALDNVLNDIDAAAGYKEGGGKPDPIWEKLSAQARADRDQFESHPRFAPKNDRGVRSNGEGRKIHVTGWSAAKARHEEALNNIAARNRAAGLPSEMPGARARFVAKGRASLKDNSQDIPNLNPDEWAQFAGKLGKFGTGQSNPRADAALAALAEKSGIAGELKMLPALAYKKELGRLGSGAELALGGSPAGRTWMMRALRGGAFRALPTLRTLGSEGEAASAAAPNADVAESTAKLLTWLTANNASPELAAALKALRPKANPYQAAPLRMNPIALRGGMFGSRTAAALPDHGAMPQPDDQKFTPADAHNLHALIDVVLDPPSQYVPMSQRTTQ